MATATELQFKFTVANAEVAQKAAEGIGRALQDAGVQGDKAGAAIESGAKRGGGALDSMGGSIKNVVAGMAAIAAAKVSFDVVAGAIASTVNVAMSFEKQMSGIGAVSGATAAEMDKLHDKALQLGSDTAFSASQAAAGMEELVKAGVSVEDVLGGAADASVALAAAGGTDLAKSAEIAAAAMNNFGLTGKELPRIADLVAGAANASAISVEDFGYSLQASGAVANLVGMDFDDLAVAITAMGNAGIKGGDAGTSLKTFLSNLIPTTDKQIGLFKKLGLITADGANQFFDASGSLKDFNQVAGVLQESLQGLSDKQKVAALDTMFGSDAIRAAAVIADTGAEGWDNLAKKMGDIKASDVAATRIDNLAGVMDAFKGTIETVQIKLGEALLPVLKKIVIEADKFVKSIDWDEVASAIERVDWATILTQIGGIVEALGKAAGFAGEVARGLGLVKPKVPTATQEVNLDVTGPAQGIGGLAGMAKPLTVPVVPYADKSFGERLGMSLKALGTEGGDLAKRNGQNVDALKADWADLAKRGGASWDALGKDTEDFVKRAKDSGAEIGREWESVQTSSQTLDANVKQAFGDMAKGAADKARELWRNVVAAWNGLWAGVSNIVTILVQWVSDKWEELRENVSAAVDAVVQWVTDQWNTLTTNVSAAVEAIKTWVSEKWEELKTRVSDTVSALREAIQSKWEEIKARVIEIVGNIRQWVVEKWEEIKAKVSDAIAGLKDAIQSKWEEIKSKVIELASAIKDKVVDVWNDVKAKVVEKVLALRDAIVAKWNEIKEKVQAAVADLRQAIIDKWNEIKSKVENVIVNLREAIIAKWNEIKDRVGKAIDDLRELARTKWEQIKETIGNVVTGIRDKIQEKWELVKAKLGELIDGLKSGVQSKIDKAVEIGTAIVEGLRDGVDAAKGLLKTAWNALCDLLPLELGERFKIKSPSKLMAAYGGMIVAGLAEGITGGRGVVGQASSGLAQSVIDAAKDTLGIHSPSDVFEQISEWITAGLESGLKDRANEMGAITAMQTVLDAMVDITKNATEIITSLLEFEMPADIDALVKKFKDLVGALNEFGLALEDMAEYAMDSTNDQYLWVKKLSEGEIERINALMPALGAIAQFVGALADSIDKVRDLDLTGVPEKFTEINKTMIGPLADLATAIAGTVVNRTGPWSTIVSEAAGAVNAVVSVVQAVANLDLSDVKPIDADKLTNIANSIYTIETEIQRIAVGFLSMDAKAQTALTEGVKRYADMVSAAAGLFAAAAGDAETWAKAANMSATQYGTIKTNIADFYTGLVAVSETFRKMDVKVQDALVEGCKRFAEIASAGASLFMAAVGDAEAWKKAANMTATQYTTIKTNISDMVAGVTSLSETFRAKLPAAQEALTEGVKRYVDMAKSAVDLFVQAGGVTVEWAKATKLPETIITDVLKPNITNMLKAVQELATTFLTLTETEKDPKQSALVDGVKRYVDMAKAATDLMTQAGGVTVEWGKATLLTDAVIRDVLKPNIVSMVNAVKELAAWFLALPEKELDPKQSALTDGVKRYVDLAKSAIDLFAQAGGLTLDWSKATAVTGDVLRMLGENIILFIRELRNISKPWRDALQETPENPEQSEYVEGMKRYADLAKAAIDVFVAAGSAATDWSKVVRLTAGDFDIVSANIIEFVRAARHLKGQLAHLGYTPEVMEEISKTVEAVVAPIKAFADAANAVNDIDTAKLITVRFLERVQENINLIIGLLSGGSSAAGGGLFAGIREDTAKLWITASQAVSAAADAMGKTGDLITGFMANPFMRAKQMRNGTWRLADWTPAGLENMRERLRLAIRESVNALTDIMNESDIQAALDSIDDKIIAKLSSLADAYGKLIDVMMKFSGVTVPDMAPLAAALSTLLGVVGGQASIHGTGGKGSGGEDTVTGGSNGQEFGPVTVNMTNTVQLGSQTLEVIFSQLFGEWSRAQTFDYSGGA